MENKTDKHQSNTLPIGSMLQEFKILSILGGGGFGIAYKVLDTHLDRLMVIKEYMPSQFASRSHDNSTIVCNPKDKDIFKWGMERFLEEAKLLSKFDHISIVKTHRVFKDNGTAYFVMDFYEGQTLEDYINQHPNKQYTQDEILSVLMPIIEGLKAVHEQGFLHRDIAPDNIFLRINKPPILIDFGASRNALGTKSQNISAIVKHGYSPPEQYTSNSNQDATTDLYAISAVMYEMITGKKPPESNHRQIEVFNGNSDPIEDIEEVYKSRFEPSFLTTIKRGLNIRQKERIQNIREYQEGLVRESEIVPLPQDEEQDIWTQTVLTDTQEGYINYLSKYPNGKHKVLANKKLDEYDDEDTYSASGNVQKDKTPLEGINTQEAKPKKSIVSILLSIVALLILILGYTLYQEKWITPSDNHCKSNGGEINSEGVCYADWENAQKICEASGGRLPTIEELKDVVTGCGGTIDDYDNNRANTSYQSCYKAQGFGSSNDYWSATTSASGTSTAWVVLFSNGVDLWNGKSSSSYVRCVR